MNEDTGDLWKLQLANTGDDTKLAIVDSNLVDVVQRAGIGGTVQTSTDPEPSDFYDNLFMFKIRSPQTIVKSYDINFDLPSGAIGNMYAIQALGSGAQISPKNTILDYEKLNKPLLGICIGMQL